LSGNGLAAKGRIRPIFALARLGPLGFLTAVAAVSAAVILAGEAVPRAWTPIGLLPLLTYLGYCYFRARRMVLAEQDREREIVRSGFVAMVADRSAHFWGFLFATITVSTCTTAVAIWAYQGWLWYRLGDWKSLTGYTVVGVVPQTDFAYLQRLLYWLADTNFGVVVLVAGLLIAAPLAAVHQKSSHKAKLRHRDLINLKKRS
jgi:hypothetical protein